MNAVNKIIDAILKVEGKYSDHPSDRGGPTMYGITEAVARANGYTGPMQDLPESLAREIYRQRYVVAPGYDRIEAVSPLLAHELVDTGVNMGPSVPAVMLQRWLNALNARGSRYADVFPDGRIGPVTVAALAAFLAWRGKMGEKVLLIALNSTQAVRYLDIAEKNQTQEDFLWGWLLQRVANILEVKSE